MPISHVSKFYAISDAKIAKLTSDPAGGAAVYGALIDVPGIKGITVSGEINVAELRGDNTLLDQQSTLSGISVSIQYAKLSLDVLPVVLGGATADAGVAPNQTAAFTRLGADGFNYFKLEGKTPTAGADTLTGDAHILLHKLILAEFPELGFAEEDYRTFSVGARAVPLLANDKWITVTLNETAAAIA